MALIRIATVLIEPALIHTNSCNYTPTLSEIAGTWDMGISPIDGYGSAYTVISSNGTNNDYSYYPSGNCYALDYGTLTDLGNGIFRYSNDSINTTYVLCGDELYVSYEGQPSPWHRSTISSFAPLCGW
jgi:hypothetical protein